MASDARPNLNQPGPGWLPSVLGIGTGLFYWWVWAAWVPGPRHFDETAYLLQARIFAGGHWAAPGRPLPEFFEQFHVLVTPVLAAKYPPGHSLLLSLGELLHFPALIPLLLNGITGALVYLLAARLAGALTGILTWLLWLLAPMNLTFRPSFLSNVTTGTLWVVGWWALLNWWEGGARRWLLVLAGCVAWCIVTRPLTGLAFAVPITVVVVYRVRQRGGWKDLAVAVALGAGVLSLFPIANQRTTGHWLQMPWTTYARVYMPYDRLGFGFDSTPPLRGPDPEMKRYNEIFRPLRRKHTLVALPAIGLARLRSILDGTWGREMLFFMLPLALLGSATMPRRAVLALATSVLLVLIHLAYPHPTEWTVYYLETVPVLAFATASGIKTLGIVRRDSAGTHRRVRYALAAGTWIIFGLWLVGAVQHLPGTRRRKMRAVAPYAAFSARLGQVPAAKAIVFVRYGPQHLVFQSLIMNEPDLARARFWIVHDRGPDNVRLLALAPDRAPFLYDAQRQLLIPLPGSDSLIPPQRNR